MKQPPVDITKISRLSRQIDPGVRSNRFVLGGAVVAALAAAAVAAMASADSVSWGVAAGGAVFLAWALAREIDPDHSGSASIAMVLALPLLLMGRPSLLLVVGALMAARMISGTVGGRLTIIDTVGMVVLAGLVGSRQGGLLVAAAMAGGFVVAQGLHRRSAIGAGSMLATAAIVSTPFRANPVAHGLAGGEAALLVASGIAGMVALRIEGVRSTTDVGAEPLSARRVRFARIVVWGLVMVSGLVLGGVGVVALTPAAAALAAVAIHSLQRSRGGAPPSGAPAAFAEVHTAPH